jgi:RNA polymerase sigma-70 factor (ECF subfamily)
MSSPANDLELRDLIERYAKGDDGSLGELVRRESKDLGRWVERRMPSFLSRRYGVSDIIQQTAIELLAVRPRFENRGVGAFRRLLRVIAGRILANTVEREQALKRNSRRGAVVRPGWTSGSLTEARGRGRPSDSDSPSGRVLRLERIDAVKRCHARLPAPDREIIRLVDYERLDHRAAANALGITGEAARKRHSRAVARLRALMEELGLAKDYDDDHD